MSIKSKIQALITAANNTTGESDTTLTDAVQTLVDGYGQGGGGGSLPSVISKIDGGSFTMTSDTAGASHWISHNLGELPKGIKVWTDDADLRTSTAAVAQRYLICSALALLNWINGTTSMLLLPNHLYRNTNGAAGNTGSPASQTVTEINIQTTRFNIAVGSLYYKAGVEYKWIAWA